MFNLQSSDWGGLNDEARLFLFPGCFESVVYCIDALGEVFPSIWFGKPAGTIGHIAIPTFGRA